MAASPALSRLRCLWRPLEEEESLEVLLLLVPLLELLVPLLRTQREPAQPIIDEQWERKHAHAPPLRTLCCGAQRS